MSTTFDPLSANTRIVSKFKGKSSSELDWYLSSQWNSNLLDDSSSDSNPSSSSSASSRKISTYPLSLVATNGYNVFECKITKSQLESWWPRTIMQFNEYINASKLALGNQSPQSVVFFKLASSKLTVTWELSIESRLGMKNTNFAVLDLVKDKMRHLNLLTQTIFDPLLEKNNSLLQSRDHLIQENKALTSRKDQAIAELERLANIKTMVEQAYLEKFQHILNQKSLHIQYLHAKLKSLPSSSSQRPDDSLIDSASLPSSSMDFQSDS